MKVCILQRDPPQQGL